jgi:hypothetical protein
MKKTKKKPKDVPEWVKKAIIPHYKNAKGSKR